MKWASIIRVAERRSLHPQLSPAVDEELINHRITWLKNVLSTLGQSPHPWQSFHEKLLDDARKGLASWRNRGEEVPDVSAWSLVDSALKRMAKTLSGSSAINFKGEITNWHDLANHRFIPEIYDFSMHFLAEEVRNIKGRNTLRQHMGAAAAGIGHGL